MNVVVGLLLLSLAIVTAAKTTTVHPSTTQSPDCPEGCRCSNSFTGPKFVCDFLDPDIQKFGTKVKHLKVNGKRGDHPPKLTRGYFAKAGLADLMTLSIVNASLEDVDREAFEGMNHLEELDLSHNNIKYLHPNTFENNPHLRHLILRNNPGIQLNNLSSSHRYQFLTSATLEQLILADCEIKDIPRRAFEGLGALDYLDLSGNYLTEIKDESLADLINLETLDVSDNSISKIGADAFIDIDDLTTLIIRGNPLKTLEGIEVNGLEELDASRCDIEVLSAAVFEGFPELILLNLSMNSIKDIDAEAFVTLSSLRYLDLSHNSIRSPLDRYLFQNCNDLETLSFANNRDFRKLEKFEGKFKLLYSLDLSNCGLYQITDGSLDNFKYLTYLNLSGNGIGHVDANAFSALTHLMNLDLSKNNLQGLNSHIFTHNGMLNRLSLSDNKFRHVPAILFQPTPDLDYLDISNNEIYGLWNFSESFVMKNKNILGHLSTLNVAGNKIKRLHMHSFISIVQLARLDISNNPIECTSDFSHMMQWLILNRVIPNHGNNPHPVEVSVIDNNIQWDQFIKEVCHEYDKPMRTDKMLHGPLKEELETKNSAADKVEVVFDEAANEETQVIPQRPIITIRGEPVEIPSFENFMPDHHMEMVEPIEDRSVVIWPVFTIWCAIALIVLAIANVVIVAVRRQRNRHPNVDYRTLERGFIVRRGGRSVYQKLYEDCSIPTVHQDVKSGSRLHTIFQLPQKV